MSRTRWVMALGVVAGLLGLGGQWYVAASAATRASDAADLALARHAAGYLSVVVPRTGTGGFDAPRLLSTANALAGSTAWPGGLQVAIGQAPLVTDSIGLAPLPDSLLAQLELGSEGFIVSHARRRAAVVPLLDTDQWTLRGWIGVWGTVPDRVASAHAGLLTLLAAGLLLFVGVASLREERRWTRYLPYAVAGTAALLALDLGIGARGTARAATDLRLETLARLVEMAATAPGVAQGRLREIGVGTAAASVGLPSSGAVVERSDSAGEPRASIVAATPRTRSGLAFTARPFEAGEGWLALQLSVLALLSAVAGLFTTWVGRGRRQPARLRETLAAWLFLAPAALHLLLFSFVPAFFTLLLAFHRWDLVGDARQFVGLANFGAILADGRFLHSLGVTALYALHVPVTAALALLAAVLLDQSGIRVRVLRTLLFLPFVSSVVAIALVWQWIFQPESGLLNAGLAWFGVTGPDWLGSPRTALLALMAMSVWVQVGYQMVVFLGGLQAIPPQYLDAARVDGAGPVARFAWVTLPLLRPTLLFVLVTGLIGSFQVFTYVAVMTEGGPLHATDVAVFRIYQEAWEFLRFGTASAMSMILLLVLLGLTWLQFRWLGRRVELV